MKRTTWNSLQNLIEEKNLEKDFKTHMENEVSNDYLFQSETVDFDVAALNFLTKKFGKKEMKDGKNILTFDNKSAENLFNEIIKENNNRFADVEKVIENKKRERKSGCYCNDDDSNDFIFYYTMGYYFGLDPLSAYCISGGSSNATFATAMGNQAANSNNGNQSSFFCSSNRNTATSSSDNTNGSSSSAGGPSNSGGGSDGGSGS